MGWRDRDYAKFRKDEFDAIYGRTGDALRSTHTSRGAVPAGRAAASRRRRKAKATRAVWRVLRIPALAVGGTAAVMAFLILTGKVDNLNNLGNKNRSYPPAAISPLPVPIAPAPTRPTAPRVTRITGTRLLSYGGSMTLRGSHGLMTGKVVISGRWNRGSWSTFGVARGDRPTYSLRIPLDRRGLLDIKIAYPDGSRAVGTYQVR